MVLPHARWGQTRGRNTTSHCIARAAAAVGRLERATAGACRDLPHCCCTRRHWTDYYRRIGLGTVQRGPFDAEQARVLGEHCAFLTRTTGLRWLPLGYSREKGYRLCSRTRPFSEHGARIICARLSMAVAQNSLTAIVCRLVQWLPPVGLDDLPPGSG